MEDLRANRLSSFLRLTRVTGTWSLTLGDIPGQSALAYAF